MPLFKRKIKVEKEEKTKKSPPDIKKEKKISKKEDSVKTFKEKSEEQKVFKKKKKIGIRHKKNEISLDEQKIDETEDKEENSDVEPNFETIEETAEEIDDEETTKKKKKKLIKRDLKGKPVYLEDTGEKLGTVYTNIYDKENNIIGYKIKDNKSDSILSFSYEQFDETSEGLIFVPSWYNKAVKTIEKLEFKDRISPELTALLSDDAVSNEELYEIFIKHDDEMAEYIEDAFSLNEFLNNRLKVLEKQRFGLKDDLMDLTEKRLIKDIDRREFSEIVLKHRRKVNILDVNINKCKDLIKRLNDTSFGILGKKNMPYSVKTKIENNMIEKIYPVKKEEKNTKFSESQIENVYKEKYLTLKEQFEQLEDEYEELKESVAKLINKNEL